ncbi:MAG: hypothetical protein U0794_01070 [Isosphaeraceae bacterium]
MSSSHSQEWDDEKTLTEFLVVIRSYGSPGHVELSFHRRKLEAELPAHCMEVLVPLLRAWERPTPLGLPQSIAHGLTRNELVQKIAEWSGNVHNPPCEPASVKKGVHRLRRRLATLVFGRWDETSRAWAKQFLSYSKGIGYRLSLDDPSIKIIIKP